MNQPSSKNSSARKVATGNSAAQPSGSSSADCISESSHSALALHTYLNTAQAAAFTCLGVQTLAKLRVYGGGPTYVKAGRKVLYRRIDLDCWLASKRRSSTSQDLDHG